MNTYDGYYSYDYYNDYYGYRGNDACIKIGYDNGYYGIFEYKFTTFAVRYRASLSQYYASSGTPPPPSGTRNYGVRVSYGLSTLDVSTKKIDLMFDIDGSNASYKFIDLLL